MGAVFGKPERVCCTSVMTKTDQVPATDSFLAKREGMKYVTLPKFTPALKRPALPLGGCLQDRLTLTVDQGEVMVGQPCVRPIDNRRAFELILEGQAVS